MIRSIGRAINKLLLAEKYYNDYKIPGCKILLDGRPYSKTALFILGKIN